MCWTLDDSSVSKYLVGSRVAPRAQRASRALRASAASYVGFPRVFAKDVATQAAHLSLVLFQAATQRATHTHTQRRARHGDIRPQFPAKGSLRECKELN